MASVPSSIGYRLHVGWQNQTWSDVSSIYGTWARTAQGHALWGSLTPGIVPGEDVIAAQIDRSAGDVFDRLTQGRGDFLLDNHAGDISPARNSAVRVNQPIVLLADLVEGGCLELEDGIGCLLLEDESGSLDLENQGEVTHYPLYYGFTYEIKASTELGKRIIRVEAEDVAATLRNKIRGEMSIKTNVGSMTWLTLSAAGFEVAARVVDDIPDLVDFAWIDDERGSDAIDRILRSGAHYWTVDALGRAVVKNRHWQETETTVATYSQFEEFETFTEDKLIKNRARITAQPRQLASDVRPVGSIDRAMLLPVGETVDFFMDYVDINNALETGVPVVSLQTLVAGTHYTIGDTETQSEGGSDLSSTTISSVTLQSLGRQALISISHVHSKPAYLQALYVAGRPLQRVGAISQEVYDAPSIAMYGAREERIDNDIIRSRIHAQGYAEWLVDRYKDGIAEVEFNLRNEYPDVLARDVLQRVHLANSHTGVASDFLIMGASHTLRFDSRGHEHTVSFALRRANPGNYFILDDATRGVLDGATYVLGF